ncbi:unnamed protein product, partial [Musa textilis]
ESTLALTFFDLAWVNAGAVERVFFYHLPHSTSYFFDSILPNLKSFLSLALQQFYPLAGKICHPLDKYEIHYADGDSVPFTVAEYEADFEDIYGSHARDINVLPPLVPQLPKSDDGRVPLLALQVTVFPNQGAAIGVHSRMRRLELHAVHVFLGLDMRAVQSLGGGRSVAGLRQEYDC